MSAPAAPLAGATADPRRPGARWPARASALAVGAWGALAFAALTTLMTGHWITLPRPERASPEIARALGALRAPGDDRRWMAVHVLSSECRCSIRILEHLVRGPRPADLREAVLLVGAEDELERRARAAGFAVEVVTPQELLERFHLVAAPLLVVVAPDGGVRHLGGYFDRQQGPEIHDLADIEAVRRGGEARERPLFGCAVSRELQALLDPFGLKYPRDERTP